MTTERQSQSEIDIDGFFAPPGCARPREGSRMWRMLAGALVPCDEAEGLDLELHVVDCPACRHRVIRNWVDQNRSDPHVGRCVTPPHRDRRPSNDDVGWSSPPQGVNS
jgi:hypothetical protein